MNLSPLPIQKFFDNNGDPLVGGLLYTYEAGTSNKTATWKDSGGGMGAQNTNPIELDFRGECRLWIDPALAYKFILSPQGDSDPPSKPIWTVDNITAGPSSQDNAAVDNGTVNNIVLSIPQITSPVAFTRIVFQASNTNTGPVTISINGGTSRRLLWQNFGLLGGGEIQTFGIYETIFDGADWQLQGPTLGPSEMRTAAEIAAAVVPSDYGYQPGDLRRYGADMTGSTNSNTAFASALAAAVGSGGTGFVYHPGGIVLITSTISTPNRVRVFGDDNSACEIKFDLTGDGFRNVNGPNSSGFALVYFERLKLNCVNNANTGAAIELNAGGFSYYGVNECWITGKWKYGVILDAVEITSVDRNIFDISGPISQIGIWVVNGNDRVGAQTPGFSNGIWITRNQVSQNGGIGLADDGGNCHWIEGNLFNECDVSTTIAKVSNSGYRNNSMESTHQIGTANVLVTNVGAVSGAVKGPCFGMSFTNNTFSQNMAGGGSCLRFAGASFHTAIMVTDNNFVDLFGRGSAIELTQLGNSLCGYNHDDGSASMSHYAGAHIDTNGNTLLLPQNGFVVTLGTAAPVYGDTRRQFFYQQGQVWKNVTVAYSAAMNTDLIAGNSFEITATNATPFTINSPSNANEGQWVAYTIRNTSGGALGSGTWGPSFKLSAWTQPANGQSRTITYRVNAAGLLIETSRTIVDVPN
ncbi:MAG TPA: hypothetical protein VGN16_04010 [Acidobacteriaceae bacterium]|jgi:hypothetical protein